MDNVSRVHRVAITLSLVALLLLTSRASAADRPWVEAKSPNFTVVSNADEKTARKIAWQFEQMRAAMQSIWPWVRADLDRPFLVLAARDEASMKALAPEYWEQGGIRPGSIAMAGIDRHYVALRSDVEADDKSGSINPFLNAYWSYTALVVDARFGRDLPLWFVRGMAAVLSNTLVRDSYLDVGRPIPWHLQALRDAGRLPLRELTTVDRSSPWFGQPDRLRVFDAESWAFVHFLMFGDKGVRLSQLNRFSGLLADGKPQAVALELAFGNLDALETAFRIYFTGQLFQFSRITADQKVRKESFAVRVLSPAEGAATRASFHVSMGRPMEARGLVDEARKADPSAAGPFEVEGLLLDREGKREEARAAFAKAIELGSTHYYSQYRWGALTWASAGSDAQARTQVEHSLEKAIAMNANFSPAYALLGEVKVQLGHREDALTLAERAVALEPGQLRNRLALARVLWALSRRDEARREAEGALVLATTDDDRRAVSELTAFFGKSGGGPPSVSETRVGQAATPQQFGPEIRFDGKGVEFGPWARRFMAQVKRNWLIPDAAKTEHGHVVLTVNVRKDGTITDLTIVAPSSIGPFNDAASSALSASSPTLSLPPEYPADRLFLTLTFFYSEKPTLDKAN